jgi:hypothetical protein
MRVRVLGMLKRVGRAVVAMAGLVTLLALQPEPVKTAAPGRAWVADGAARTLTLSDQARRYLAIQYRAYPTEFMGCMIGEVRGQAVFVQRIAPADVDTVQSTRTHVVPHQTCEHAGWSGTVGVIHSHPGGDRCWYFFPGTQVATSDAQSFLQQPYPVDAIMCGDRVVWISRNGMEQQVRLVEDKSVNRVEHPRGNRVHAGASSTTGVD